MTGLKESAIYLRILLLVLLQGCWSATLPPDISQQEKMQLEKVHLNLDVAVKRGNLPEIYYRNLAQALRDTGLFDKVYVWDQWDRKNPPHLFAESDRRANRANPLPFFTALTLGFFPTISEDQYGYSFLLKSIDNAGPPCDAPLPLFSIGSNIRF